MIWGVERKKLGVNRISLILIRFGMGLGFFFKIRVRFGSILGLKVPASPDTKLPFAYIYFASLCS